MNCLCGSPVRFGVLFFHHSLDEKRFIFIAAKKVHAQNSKSRRDAARGEEKRFFRFEIFREFCFGGIPFTFCGFLLSRISGMRMKHASVRIMGPHGRNPRAQLVDFRAVPFTELKPQRNGKRTSNRQNSHFHLFIFISMLFRLFASPAWLRLPRVLIGNGARNRH